MGQTWSFSALVSHLLAFFTPVVEPKHPVVLEACCASRVCVSVPHTCGHPCRHMYSWSRAGLCALERNSGGVGFQHLREMRSAVVQPVPVLDHCYGKIISLV